MPSRDAEPPSPALVQALLPPLVYSPDFHVVLCQACRCGLGSVPNIRRHVARHISSPAGRKTFAKQLLDRFEALGIAADLEGLAALPGPAPYTTWFADLRAIQGYSCNLCPFLSRNYKELRKHLSSSHGIRSSNKRGDSLVPSYRFPVVLQTFGSHSRNIAYFITSQNVRPGTEPPPDSRDADIRRALNEYQTSYKQLIRDSQENRKDLGSKELSGFLLNSHWHEYFLTTSKEAALQLLEKAEEGSAQAQIGDITRRLLRKLEGLIPLVSRRNLQMLHSETLQPAFKEMRAFQAVTAVSRGRYHALFPGLLGYLLNVYEADRGRLEGDLKGKGAAPEEAPAQPDLEPVRPLLADLLSLVDDLETFPDQSGDDYQAHLKTVEECIITVLITLLEQKTQQQALGENSLFRSPVITFLLLQSVDRQTGGFKDEGVIQNYTSILIYSFRLAFLGLIRLQGDLEAFTNPPGADFDTTFKDLYTELLTNTSNNCFEELTQLRAYSHKISSTQLRPGRIIDHSPNEVEIDSKRIRVDSLRTLFGALFDQLDGLLYDSLLFTNRLDLALDTTRIQDNIFDQTIGFYFADFVSQSQDLGPYKELLIRKLFDPSSGISRRLVSKIDGKRLEFRSAAVNKLYSHRTHFLELLLAAIYLTSGSPIRGEEILPIRFRNTLTTKTRNIVIDPKTHLIRLVTTYYKSFNITRAEKANIRFLCPRLSRILTTYLLVFIPLYHFVNVSYLDRKQLSPDLFENRGARYTSMRLSTVLRRESLRLLGESLTINPYRHLIKYIIKTRIAGSYDSSSEGEDLIEDVQANHSTRTSNRVYSREVTGQILNTNLSIEGRSLGLNQRVFTYFRIDRDTDAGQLPHGRETSPAQPPWVPGANPSKHTRQTSSVDQGAKKQRVVASQTFPERLLNRQLLHPDRPPTPQLVDSLRSLLRAPTASFRSRAQEEAIQSVTRREPQVTYIGATGSGKSLLFFLPYHTHPARWHFFIITPRVSLKNDLQRRAQAFQLQAEIYSESEPIRSRMVFLSVEDLNTNRFQTYVSTVVATQQHVSFFFDEAHLLVLEEDFRHVLRYIPDVVRYRQQLVFISATLPDCLLNVLEAKFSLVQNRIIRGSTTRPNVSYRTQAVGQGEDRDRVAQRLFRQLRARLLPGEKIVVFCPYKSQCEALGQALGIPCYYSDKAGKEALLERFQADDQTVGIAGTTALGVGLDVARIRFCIHPYRLESLIQFDQEVGRVGRDGRASESHILVGHDRDRYRHRAVPTETGSLAYVQSLDYNRAIDLVRETRCMRTPLESFFNHQTLDKCPENVLQACSLCAARQRAAEATARRQQGQAVERLGRYQALEGQLVELHGACWWCALQPDQRRRHSSAQHSINDCKTDGSELFIAQVRRLERKLKELRMLPKGSCCFQCFLPPGFCHNRQLRQQPCLFQGIVLEAVVLGEVRRQMQATGKRLEYELITLLQGMKIPSMARSASQRITYQGQVAIAAIPIVLETRI